MTSDKDTFDLVSKNIEEMIGEETIVDTMRERQLRVYWGTAMTGIPHFAYFIPLYKCADLLKAGCHVTILLADLHGYMDSDPEVITSFDIIGERCAWYELIIKAMLQRVGVDVDEELGRNLDFVRGSSYQLSPEYTRDVYKLCSRVSIESAKHAGSEVVKRTSSAGVASILYPILQALDEEYLRADVQLGGSDQRKIFMFAREIMPSLGYASRAYLLNYLMPSLGKSGKMSSTDASSRIDLLDSDDTIRQKIKDAFSVDRLDVENVLLEIMRVLFRYLDERNEIFTVHKSQEHGGIVFTCFQELEHAFATGKISSAELKPAVADLVIEFISPVRAHLLVARRQAKLNT